MFNLDVSSDMFPSLFVSDCAATQWPMMDYIFYSSLPLCFQWLGIGFYQNQYREECIRHKYQSNPALRHPASHVEKAPM